MRASADLEDSCLVNIRMLETANPQDALRKSVRALYTDKNTLQSIHAIHTDYMPFEMTEPDSRRAARLDVRNCCEQRFAPKPLSVLIQTNECIQLCSPKICNLNWRAGYPHQPSGPKRNMTQNLGHSAMQVVLAEVQFLLLWPDGKSRHDLSTSTVMRGLDTPR